MIKMYKHTIILSCFIGLFACNSAPKQAVNSTSVELANVHQHIKTLASDTFEGRGPLSHGEDLSIEYIANEYKKLGLKGGHQGKFFEPVPLVKITPNKSMTLNMGDLTFNIGDFTARTEHVATEITLNDSDVVFVGYGINAPEYNWNDYANIDVKGKTVIMLVNDPGFATQDNKLFTGNAMTYYGRWTYKWEEAVRQGAKAAFIIHETAPAAYPWSVVFSSNTGSMYALVDNDKNNSRLPILGWIQNSTADKIFNKIGSSYLKEKALALTKSFKSKSLNMKANLTLKNTLEQAESNNVVALLEGSKYPDEYIVISAHWDHFGTQVAEDGRIKILNGAIDNATGVAGTIELARMLTAQHAIKPFERSIIFVNFTAEETGLLGSAMFAQGGSVAMKNVVSVLNIDGMNALDAIDYVLQYGQNMSEMEDYLAKFSAKQGRHVKLDPRPQNGLFFRSDHFSFAKQGVPSLLFMSLGDTDPDYIPFKYHKEGDDYSAEWSLGGVEQDLTLIQLITTELANSRDWPKWKSESDFKKRRAIDGK